jgi:outer membrane protein TolC
MQLKNKRKTIRTGLFLWIVLLLGHGTMAQTQQLTLQDALQYALKASHDVRKAQLDIENGTYQIDEVKARALPQINANGSLTYNPVLQLTALPGELAGQPGKTLLVAFGQKWNTGASLSLSQTLFDQGVFTGLKAAKSTQEFYRLNAELTEEQLIELVASAYYQVLVQRHKIGVLDTTIVNTERVQKIIKGQYENGLAKQIDVDRIAVKISNLQSQKQQALNTVTQMENQLKYSMGMTVQNTINLPPVDFSNIQPQLQPIGDSLDISNRSEMRLLKQQGLLLKFQKDAVKAEYFPTLSLSGNYGYQGLGNEFPWFKGPTVNWFDYASVGLTLKVPIFNGFATRSRIRQADVEIRKLKEDIDQTSLSLNLQYENAKTKMNSSFIVMRNQADNVDLAQKVFDNTRNNYNNGLAPLTDLLDAETSLTEANNNHSAALLDYKLAEIQLIKAKGNLKTLLNK